MRLMPRTLARALKMDASLAAKVYDRIVEKLRREPVEDFRLDFEDGYGNRADAEEDGHAAPARRKWRADLREKTLPPFIGIRIKPLNEDLRGRGASHARYFCHGASAKATGGKLPDNFVITVPKIQLPEQVTRGRAAYSKFSKRRLV